MQVDTSRSLDVCIYVKFTVLYDLPELTSRLASPFDHPSQVRTEVLVLQTCIELRVRVASGFRLECIFKISNNLTPNIFLLERFCIVFCLVCI